MMRLRPTVLCAAVALGCASEAKHGSDAGDDTLACFTDLGVPLPMVEDLSPYYASPEAEIESAQAACQVAMGVGAAFCLEPLLTRDEVLCATLRAGGVPGPRRWALTLMYEAEKMRFEWRVASALEFYYVLVLDGHTGLVLDTIYNGPMYP